MIISSISLVPNLLQMIDLEVISCSNNRYLKQSYNYINRRRCCSKTESDAPECMKKKQSATLNALIDLVVCEQVNLPNNDKDLENTVIAYFEDLERLIFKVSIVVVIRHTSAINRITNKRQWRSLSHAIRNVLFQNLQSTLEAF